MGKGDARSKRGKIFKGSFGNSRPKHQGQKQAKGPAAQPKAAPRPAAPAAAPRSRGKR